MNLKLVKATTEYKNQITEMLDELYASGEKIIPYYWFCKRLLS